MNFEINNFVLVHYTYEIPKENKFRYSFVAQIVNTDHWRIISTDSHAWDHELNIIYSIPKISMYKKYYKITPLPNFETIETLRLYYPEYFI